MVSSQVIVVEDPDVEDGVVGAETKVEDGAEADRLQREVVLVGSRQGHQPREDWERWLDAEEGKVSMQVFSFRHNGEFIKKCH